MNSTVADVIISAVILAVCLILIAKDVNTIHEKVQQILDRLDQCACVEMCE
jgi:hypothetical protein